MKKSLVRCCSGRSTASHAFRIGLIGFGLMMIAFVAGPRWIATAQELELIDKFEVKQPAAASSTKTANPEQVSVKTDSLPRPSAKEKRILDALNESAEVSFMDNPLEECLNYLEDVHHIEIWINKQALSDEGVNTDQPVTLVMSGISLRSALRLMLEPLGLTYVIEDEVMKVTTQSQASESISTRTYPVGDLFTTRKEADELIESFESGLGISPKNKDKDRQNPLTVSVSCGAIIARLSRPQHDQLLQLIRDLREAKSLKPSVVPMSYPPHSGQAY